MESVSPSCVKAAPNNDISSDDLPSESAIAAAVMDVTRVFGQTIKSPLDYYMFLNDFSEILSDKHLILIRYRNQTVSGSLRSIQYF